MPGTIATFPKLQFATPTGAALAGGTLDVYLAGTTTRTTTWQDSSLSSANTNPVVLDSRGACVVWLDSTKRYKLVLKNAAGVSQWTQDNIIGGGVSGAIELSAASIEAARSEAAASAAAALATRTAIDNRYRGALAADPATRTDGSANVVGDEVFNSTAGLLKRWNGSIWLASDLNTANLAAPGGAGLVGYLPAGTGAVARTVESKGREQVSLFDFGGVCDGIADDSTAMTKLAAYVNSLPNTTGQPVAVSLYAGLIPRVKFGTAIQFTRPVYLYGHGITLDYTGVGNAITLGPTGLTSNSLLHKHYGVIDVLLVGGATATHGIYVPPWVSDPFFEKIKTYNFGTTGYAIFCQYNNWNCYFKDCNFFSGGAGYTTQTNYIKVAGVALDGVTVDNGNSRANVIDCWMRWGGVSVGGVGAWLTGAKSRVVGGGAEGAKIGVLFGAGASFSEVSGFYGETLFDAATPPTLIQVSDAGDPYFTAGFTDFKGLRITETYCNLHNFGDSFTPPTTGVFLTLYSDAVKLLDGVIDNIDLVEKKFELIKRPGVNNGHRIEVGTVNVWGAYSADTYRLETGDASPYRMRLKNKVSNLLPNPAFRTWSNDLSAQAGSFSGYALASNITTSADGTGGSRSIVRTPTPFADGSLQILDMETYYAQVSCTNAGTASFWAVDFATSARYRDIVGQRVLLSFLAKAPANVALSPYLLLQHINAGQTVHSLPVVTVNSAGWAMFSTFIIVPEVQAGVNVAPTAGVVCELGLPTGTFSLSIANCMLHVGGIEYPLHCSNI